MDLRILFFYDEHFYFIHFNKIDLRILLKNTARRQPIWPLFYVSNAEG